MPASQCWARRPFRQRSHSRHRRAGAILVWTSLILVVLLGMVGLVIDGGLLMAAHRHAQNAADAGALAAAMARLRGKTATDAIADGTTYIKGANHNNLPNATAVITNPPTTGPYTGSTNYFEATVTNPLPTYFIHVLPGMTQGTTVTARAVAGWELVAAGEGVITLNPEARPGLKVSGGGNLIVEGDVIVNSLGGGEDENGASLGNGQPGAQATNNSTVIAENILVAGGVNDADNFTDITVGEEALDAGTGITYPDPFVDLPTPTTANGVLNINRGSPSASSGKLKLNNPQDDPTSPNFIENPGTANETMVLKPGIYQSISVTGGKVRFQPGIYVLRPPNSVTFVLTITGGTVQANGVMFYNTGNDYNPATGSPDNADLEQTPPTNLTTSFGKIKINASVPLHPIDYDAYSGQYSTAAIKSFDGFLFYQRRWNTKSMQIEGNSSSGDLTGTLYSKWGTASISGQGTYDAQFAVGSLDITGQGNITLTYDGDALGKAPRIFLVE